MKKTILCLTLPAIFLMLSCQKDNSQDENTNLSSIQKENWLSADLDAKFANSQKQVTAYLFANEEMSKLVETPNIKEVHFVLGYSDSTIQISIVGVDKSGKKLGTVNSTILKEPNYETKLNKLSELSVSQTRKRTTLLNSHLLLSKDALAGIKSWKEKLNSVSDLNEVTSYEGARFRYFILESDIVKDMVDKTGTKNIGVFFGLNPKGKVTTILIGLDKNNAIKQSTSISKEIDDVYDGSRPVPPFGDPVTP